MTRWLVPLSALILLIFGLPVLEPAPLELRWVDADGVDRPCPESRAWVTRPDRTVPGPFSLFEDFAYAAAAGGPEGTALFILVVAVPIAFFGFWIRGIGCGIRRCWVAISLGMPLAMALIYASCFIEGRSIRLGPDAAHMATANLNTKTNSGTGILSPKDLLIWHVRHRVFVVNVADRNRIDGALVAAQLNRARPFRPPLTLIVGEELRLERDLVLLNIAQPYPHEDEPLIKDVAAQIEERGGATFLAHPWSRGRRPIAKDLANGVHGTELVNGVIHGGQAVIVAARHGGLSKALLGTTALKFGPHLNALTLIPRQAARSARGVVAAIRAGRTEVLYAVPGGTVSVQAYEANQLQAAGILPVFRSLLETPRSRRAVWLISIVLVFSLWCLSVATVKTPQLPSRLASFLLCGSGLLLLLMPLAMHWKFRALVGPIPINALIFCSAPLALIVLAATHNLSLYEDPLRDSPKDSREELSEA